MRDWCTHHCAGEALKSRGLQTINENLEDIVSPEMGISMGTLSGSKQR